VEPVFLELADALRIHQDQLERYGGSTGVRDMHPLHAALGAPKSGMAGQYFHEDLHAMAAAYLFHIARNHPFVDGNERVAGMTAYVFLAVHGCELRASDAAFERMVRRAATGEADKAEIAAFLRKHTSA
jgi:death-on-curing protein